MFKNKKEAATHLLMTPNHNLICNACVNLCYRYRLKLCKKYRSSANEYENNFSKVRRKFR